MIIQNVLDPQYVWFWLIVGLNFEVLAIVVVILLYLILKELKK